jgi:hypothetical protein
MTFIFKVGYTKRFSLLATLILIMLCVLESISDVMLYCFTCPFNFIVSGCVIPAIVAMNILGISSSFDLDFVSLIIVFSSSSSKSLMEISNSSSF